MKEKIKKVRAYNILSGLTAIGVGLGYPVWYAYDKLSAYKVTLQFEPGVFVFFMVVGIIVIMLLGWATRTVGFNRWGIMLILMQVILVAYGFKVTVQGLSSISDTLIKLAENLLGGLLLSLPFAMFAFPIPVTRKDE